MILGVLRIYRVAFSGLPRPIWLLCTAALVNRAGTMVLPFIALYLTQERGLGTAAAGRLIGLFGLGSMLGSFLGGWISDRFGTRRAMLWSLLGGGLGFLILGQMRETWTIGAAVLGASALSDSFRPANMAAIAERSPADLQARSFALLRLAANAGMAIGPALGGVLAIHGYGWLFLIDGLTCWLAAGLLFVLLAEIPRPALPQELPIENVGSPWRDTGFLALLAVAFTLACVFFQVFTTLPLTLRDLYGLRENGIGTILAVNALLIVVFEMIVIHAIQRWNRMHAVGLGSVLVCLGLAMTPLGVTTTFVLLTLTIWTVGEMVALPMLNVAVADRAPPEQRGRYMGLYTMSFALAFVVAPLVGTAVYSRWGARALWFGTGAMAIPIGVACAMLSPGFARRHGKRSPGQAAPIRAASDRDSCDNA